MNVMLSSRDLQRLLVKSRSDPDAADRLLTLYRPVLKLMAEQMVGPGLRHREDASDVVQRTVLEAYQAFQELQASSEAEFAAWLKQILRRNVTNLVRDNWAAKRDVRRERHPDSADASLSVAWKQPAGKTTPPSQHIIKAEAAINLAQALATLPDDQRTAVRLRHLDACGIQEIAATMQKSPAAVAGLIRRGLQTLRERMAGDTSWL